MKNKRGLWLGEETGKIVLAIIGIVLMIFLIFKLIGILIQKTEYEQAKVAMKEIEYLIKEGVGVKYYLIESPKNWAILRDLNNDTRLCFCPTKDIWGLQKIFKTEGIKDTLKNSCKQKGVCANFNKKINVLSSCHIVVPNCALTEKVPTTLVINVKKDNVEILAKEYEPEDYDYFIKLGAICSFLGWSGLTAASEVERIFSTSSGIMKVSEIALQPGGNAIVLTKDGKEVGLLIESNYAGKYILSRGGTNEAFNLIIKETGEVVDEGGKVIGYLAKGSKVLLKTTTKTGEVMTKSVTLGEEVTLAVGKGTSLAISKSAGKIFTVFSKGLKVAGVVTTFAGTACDVYVAARVGVDAFKSYKEALESGKVADKEIFETISLIKEKQESTKKDIEKLKEEFEEEEVAQIETSYSIVETKIKELEESYKKYSNNREKGTGSELSEKEYAEISSKIKEVVSLITELNNKIISLYEE